MPMKTLKKPMIVYKKVWRGDRHAHPTYDQCYMQEPGKRMYQAILVLRIPKGAKIFIPPEWETIAGSVKCRASTAFVLRAERLTSAHKVPNKIFHADFEWGFEYHLRKTIKPDRFDRRGVQCSSGIHVFLTKQEAVEYSSI